MYECWECAKGYEYEPQKPESRCFCSDACTEAYRNRTGRQWPPAGFLIPAGPGPGGHVAFDPSKLQLTPGDRIIADNVAKDPNYCPYCMRCTGLVRMTKVEPLYWRCTCGAEHDMRWPKEPEAPKPQRPSTEAILADVKAYVAQKKAEGWTREDFANALGQMLNSPTGDVCVGCGGRLGWYDEDQWVGCLHCPEGRAEHAKHEEARLRSDAAVAANKLRDSQPSALDLAEIEDAT